MNVRNLCPHMHRVINTVPVRSERMTYGSSAPQTSNTKFGYLNLEKDKYTESSTTIFRVAGIALVFLELKCFPFIFYLNSIKIYFLNFTQIFLIDSKF